MSKETLFIKIRQSSMIWVVVLTVVYLVLLFIGVQLDLGVLRLYFKYGFYIIFIVIVIGYLLIIKSQHSALSKFIVFFLSIPIFSLGSFILINSPMLLDKKQFDGYIYYLNLEPQLFDPPFVHLYKCKNYIFNCEETSISFFAYSTRVIDYSLGIDTIGNEINVIAEHDNGDTFLIYAYGDQPRYYESPERVGNKLYYLASYKNSEIVIPYQYTFMLYQCNLDNTGCKRIPFQYILKERGNLRLDINNKALEISVLEHHAGENNDILIYTYGEHPRCYVEGCQITDK